MPSLDEIKRAGLEVSDSGAGDQIMGLLSGIPDQIQKRKEKEKEDVMEQVKLYGELRQAGYSPEDAHKKVTRTYRSTGFIERMVNGDTNAFTPPTGVDKTELDTTKSKLENRKTAAEIGKVKAETRKANAQADAGGFASSRYNRLDGLTPNQIQMRIKDLRNQIGLGTAEEDTELENEVGYLNDLFNKKSGFKEEAPAETPPGSAAPGKKPGTPSKNSVVMTGPDGKRYRIPKQNVEKAKARGFK